MNRRYPLVVARSGLVVARSPDRATLSDRRSPASPGRPAVGRVAGSGDPATTGWGMNRRCLLSGLAVMLLAVAPQAWSAEPVPERSLLTPEQLAARIDHWVAARWAERGV